MKEKVENLVLFDEKTFKRLLDEVPKVRAGALAPASAPR